MNPEQDKDGVWFVVLPDGQRKEFKSNSEAWSRLDRRAQRELWRSSKSRLRAPLSYALPKKET
jgi:hypothetical protein